MREVEFGFPDNSGFLVQDVIVIDDAIGIPGVSLGFVAITHQHELSRHSFPEGGHGKLYILHVVGLTNSVVNLNVLKLALGV